MGLRPAIPENYPTLLKGNRYRVRGRADRSSLRDCLHYICGLWTIFFFLADRLSFCCSDYLKFPFDTKPADFSGV